ncbi:MAG: ABC transporter, partial [Novosphingobium sp.]
RRPQDVVLLSPILSRWGLELTFDDRQPAGLRTVAELPVDLPGRWQTTSPDCRLAAEALLAECRVGQGRVLALADAEILAADDADGLREPALGRLLRTAFAPR